MYRVGTWLPARRPQFSSARQTSSIPLHIYTYLPTQVPGPALSLRSMTPPIPIHSHLASLSLHHISTTVYIRLRHGLPDQKHKSTLQLALNPPLIPSWLNIVSLGPLIPAGARPCSALQSIHLSSDSETWNQRRLPTTAASSSYHLNTVHALLSRLPFVLHLYQMIIASSLSPWGFLAVCRLRAHSL